MDGGGEGKGPLTADLRRSIGFWGGVALIVGTVIGGGIFRTPASIAEVLPDPRFILVLWVAFGVVTICGALTLAELTTMMPQTGGTYVYLRAAFGDASAFAFGWLYMLAAIPSGMAALAVFFGELLSGLAGLGAAWAIPGIAIATIVLLSGVNIVGVRWGTALQGVFTVVKVGALLTLIATAFLFVPPGPPAKAGGATVPGFAEAAASVMFTYNGWVYIALVAGEIADPARLKRIILVGTLTVVGVYLSANLAYLWTMSPGEMAGKVVAVELMRRAAGSAGATAITACIMASVFGALNGVILTKARVGYALARDRLSFAALGRCHPKWATPWVSIAVQGVVALALVVALRDPENPRRLFNRMTAYFVVVEWLALVFAIAAVFVLRRKRPEAARPYRTPGYPWVPVLFILPTSAALVGILWSNAAKGDWAPLIGLGIALAGFPVYWIWKRAGGIVAGPPRDEP